MPTRQGWIIVGAAVGSIVVGRTFGVLELFVIGVAMAAAVAFAVLTVQLRPANALVTRWIHPRVLSVGEAGRVDLLIENRRALSSAPMELIEAVGPDTTARLRIGRIPASAEVTAGYRVPAAQRGVLDVGPTVAERRDLLGLAAHRRIVAGAEEIVVAPRTVELGMPELGSGILGRHMLALSQRLGPGEFHSLRDYVAGDEPRTIHWKASARSDGLKVRQHEAQGLKRCVVHLDADLTAYDEFLGDDGDAFERAVSISASILESADRLGLTTRFIGGGMCDLRGADIASRSIPHLARIQLGAPTGRLERDPGEGLGLYLIVTASPAAASWSRYGRPDPTLARVGVFTGAASGGLLELDATSMDAFATSWRRLTGEAVTPMTREAVDVIADAAGASA